MHRKERCRGADARVSTASDAGARVSQSGAEPGRDSQISAGGAMAAAEEVGRVSRQLEARMSSSPEAPAKAGRVSQQSAGGYPQAADASLARASQQLVLHQHGLQGPCERLPGAVRELSNRRHRGCFTAFIYVQSTVNVASPSTISN